MASSVAHITHSFLVDLKIGSTKSVSSDHSHYNPHSVSKKRGSLVKTLGFIKCIQAQLKLISASHKMVNLE